MKRILGAMRKAIEEYKLIEDGDKIGVGLSGGKDSMLLLYGLKLFQGFSPYKFDLEAFTIDMGFEGFDLSPVEEFCTKIDVPYTIIKTHIGKVVFDLRNEKNPCSLCAKMRRGALHNAIKEKNCNKVALGHHSDDVIETLFISMFYEGRINTFLPKTYLSRKDIHAIRPMIYLTEHQVIGAIEKYKIPVIKSPCPMDKKTKREEIKLMLKDIYKEIPEARERIMTAIRNKDQVKLWE